MTPRELNEIKSAVAQAAADLLARDSNPDTTAEAMAEELADAMIDSMIDTYEAIMAKSYNLVVVAQFELNDGQRYTAAVGPLSTRAKQRARDVGARFAWDYKSRTGSGKYTLVPLIRNPNEAWDEARAGGLEEFSKFLDSVTPGVEATYEAMRFEMPDSVRAKITADWQADPEILRRQYGPACICALPVRDGRNNLGRPYTTGCPRHPKESDGPGIEGGADGDTP